MWTICTKKREVAKVLHLHGELCKVTSSRNRLDPNCIKDYPLDVPIRIGDKAGDGSQLRPYIVWFGEYVDNMDEATRFVKQADIFVVIGTSLVVYPAAGLVNYAKREILKFLIDPNDLKGGLPMGYQHIKATAVEGVDELVKRLEGMGK